MIICETSRLRLRQLSDEDAPFILELHNDPMFVQNIGDRGVRTLEDAQTYIKTGPRASYVQFGFGLWLVEQKQQPVSPIGMCGLLRRDSHPDVELGFAFLPEGRGKGYATEASRAVLDSTRSLNLTRIVAVTAPGNRDSIHVPEKLGFRYERLFALTAKAAPVKLFVLQDPQQVPGLSRD